MRETRQGLMAAARKLLIVVFLTELLFTFIAHLAFLATFPRRPQPRVRVQYLVEDSYIFGEPHDRLSTLKEV
jgi:hypothetical protein